MDIKKDLQAILTQKQIPEPVIKELEPHKEPPAPPKIPKPKKEPRRRTLGDVYSALEAQRIYNPNEPSVPKPPGPPPVKAPPANLADRGTAAATDMSGAWGGAEKK